MSLQSLHRLAVTLRLQLDRTTMDVGAPDGGPPVARLVKEGDLRRRLAYDIRTGPELDEPAGQLTSYGALGTDGGVIGVVNPSHGRHRVPDGEIHPLVGLRQGRRADNPAHWTVAQHGLPPLTGEAVGLPTRLTFNRVAEFASHQGLDLWMFDHVTPLHFHYGAKESPGFSVSRSPGRARFEITVHDLRVDRRVPLALLAAISQYVLASPRTEAVDAANIARRLLRRPKK